MALISFRAKPEDVFYMDGTFAHRRIKVPTLTRSHCDMNAMCKHPKFGSYANSDLFPNMLARIQRERLGKFIRLDRVPDGVEIDTSGFLFKVSIDV